MDLATIEMPKEEAKAAYDDYVEALRHRHSEEDAAIAEGYKALAAGKQLISLPQVIGAAGVDDALLPRLAIAPATAAWVWTRRSREGAVSFSVTQQPRANSRHVIRLPGGTLPAADDRDWYARDGYWKLGRYCHRAMVPIVPPRLRPTRALTTYHVLFEAEWDLQPPVDPALLKHIGGDLWVVLGTWDLTELERSVLSRRLAT